MWCATLGWEDELDTRARLTKAAILCFSACKERKKKKEYKKRQKENVEQEKDDIDR